MKKETLGYSKNLFILAFDHRGSFQKKMFGIHGDPNPEETQKIASFKKIIFEGFKLALEQGVPRESAGILVDEQFGTSLLEEAKKLDLVRACPAEKSGQDEFDFEYGNQFASHIERFQPTFVKVLVRYNPQDESPANKRQIERLKKLSDYCKTTPYKFLFELLVPPLPNQLARVSNDQKRFEKELRPQLMTKSIQDFQQAGVEPDIWKVEGLESVEAAHQVAQQARSGGRTDVGIVILGRGEDDRKVREWLKIASRVPGFLGFAVGRTIFWDPLKAVLEGRLNQQQATEQVAENYKGFYNCWMQH